MAVLSRRDETQAQREEVERAFVIATASLLAEENAFADITVAQIAQRAGRTRTAFYFYFRDKRELLIRVTEQIGEGLFDEADRWWSGSGGVLDLRIALRNILTAYRDHGALLLAVVEAAGYDAAIAAMWRTLVERFIDATERRLVADGRAEGAHATAFVLVWMTERSAYQHVASGGQLDDDSLLGALGEVWERAIYPAR